MSVDELIALLKQLPAHAEVVVDDMTNGALLAPVVHSYPAADGQPSRVVIRWPSQVGDYSTAEAIEAALAETGVDRRPPPIRRIK